MVTLISEILPCYDNYAPLCNFIMAVTVTWVLDKGESLSTRTHPGHETLRETKHTEWIQKPTEGCVLVAEGTASIKALHLNSYTPQRPKDKPKENREQLRELEGVFSPTWHPLCMGGQQWFSPPGLIHRENLTKILCAPILNNTSSNSKLLWLLQQNTAQKDDRQNFIFWGS